MYDNAFEVSTRSTQVSKQENSANNIKRGQVAKQKLSKGQQRRVQANHQKRLKNKKSLRLMTAY
ncbi:hypothetical protein S70_11865 [Providencia stuartii MRSN 2154]|uniref:Uncharacterized protein n=1 Tax=Providencia stuartii (strain MRSN 2154) TaxID=1157951 RepID=A0A140NNJ1_PROSM|nr:hypothetical protein S70_11865 [Providencia stuartii MRSN 2154]